jgi:hypothetical protein
MFNHAMMLDGLLPEMLRQKLRGNGFAHGPRADGWQLFACPKQLCHLFLGQRTDLPIGLLSGVSMTNPALGEEVWTVTHV